MTQSDPFNEPPKVLFRGDSEGFTKGLTAGPGIDLSDHRGPRRVIDRIEASMLTQVVQGAVAYLFLLLLFSGATWLIVKIWTDISGMLS